MFGFGKKKENPDRKAFRDEFETMTARLRSADEVVQIAVGHSINLAFSLFRQTHATPQAFKRLATSEQFAYIGKLTDMENRLRDEKGDMAASLGFGLFKMWVGTLASNDNELERQFSDELAYFSKKGNLPA
jgi:hypothetical protein